MRYLVVSDSHGNNRNLSEVVKREKDIKGMFHLGDLQCSRDVIEMIAGCPVYAVAGNNDYSYDLQDKLVFNIEGVRIAMAHGHQFHASFSTNRLEYWAEENGAQVVLFGHTHRPYLDQSGRVTIHNPGSITYPRQEGRKPTYTVMEINADGLVKFHMKELK
jgi:putative phosphoesterase